MWIKRNDHAPKSESVKFFNICLKRTIVKYKSSLTILLSLFVFTSLVLTFLIFLFSFVFTLSFNKYGCNGGEKQEKYFAFRIIHVFVHVLSST